MCVCVCVQAVRIDLNKIIDLLYSIITLGISRPDEGFSLLTGRRNPFLRECPISSPFISDKPVEFYPFIRPYVYFLTGLIEVKRLTGRDVYMCVCVCVCSEHV